MPGVQRVGDFNAGAGVNIGPGHNNVLVNGRPAAKPYGRVLPHLFCTPKTPWHCIAIVLSFPSSVRINGTPVVVDGALDSCLHPRVFGSRNVRSVGGPGIFGALVSAASAYYTSSVLKAPILPGR